MKRAADEADTQPSATGADGDLPLRLGRLVGRRWLVERLLGLGGMSAVYQVKHRDGSRAALKVLRPELSFQRQVRSRFLNERTVAVEVGHPGVVRFIDDGRDGPLIFIVMELLVGETLAARAGRYRRGLPPRQVLRIADAVLDVLASAHDKGIVHRDIKPENVFLTTSGAVKVMDFGIASSRTGREAGDLTLPGVSLGTPPFMPREQARGLTGEVDGRSDLWALGATMFTMLSGRHVFEGRTPVEVLIAAATQEPPPLGAHRPGLPAGVAAVVDRALRVDRRERWPDARAMQDALRSALAELAGEAR
jgi:serine/threonine-protein kinase